MRQGYFQDFTLPELGQFFKENVAQVGIALTQGCRSRSSWLGVIGEQCIVNTCDIREEMGHKVKELKIALAMSHNTLTRVEEYVK